MMANIEMKYFTCYGICVRANDGNRDIPALADNVYFKIKHVAENHIFHGKYATCILFFAFGAGRFICVRCIFSGTFYFYPIFKYLI